MTINLGLIGAGQWGTRIIQTCKQLPGINLNHIARHSNNRSNVPETCQLHSDWQELLHVTDIDGVIIATTANLHAEITKAALALDLPVYVEKPHALSVEDAQFILDFVSERSGILKIGYIDLYNGAWRSLVKNLSLIEEITKIEAVFGGAGPIRTNISPLWDWGPHPVALSIALCGEPKNFEVSLNRHEETTRGIIENIEIVFDNARTNIKIGNDLENSHRRVNVKGSAGTLIYDDQAVDKIIYANKNNKTLNFDNTPPLTNAIKSFVDAIDNANADFGDALLGLQVTKALTKVNSLLH